METQSREQHYGIEHIGVDTDDYTATLARLRANGVRVLEELTLTASDLRLTAGCRPGSTAAASASSRLPTARRSKSSRRSSAAAAFRALAAPPRASVKLRDYGRPIPSRLPDRRQKNVDASRRCAIVDDATPGG